VAINTAILVTLLVNACFRQAFPGYQFKARLVVMLRQTARANPSGRWATYFQRDRRPV
jgi:multidrug resistance protein MdtO